MRFETSRMRLVLTNLSLIFSLLLGFVLTLILTPASIKIGNAVQAVDQPGDLSIHSKPTPRFGGLAIFLGVAGTLLVFPNVWQFMPPRSRVLLGLALLSIFLTGVVDDIRDLNAKTKFLLQVVSTALAAFGLYFIFFPPLLPLILAAFFLLLYTNSFNLIDGMDGLATGLALIVALALAVIAFYMQNGFVLSAALLIASSCAAFLLFNWNPAKIFLGDSGSTFLGFTLALLASMLWLSAEMWFVFLPLLVVAAIPLIDTVAAVWRRLKQRTSIFSGDRNHLYDVLLQRGFSTGQTLFIFYSSAILCASIGVSLFLLHIS